MIPARCYFAVGDIENAIRMQKRAIKQMPHSPPLRRQLGEFETALAKKDSSGKESPSKESPSKESSAETPDANP